MPLRFGDVIVVPFPFTDQVAIKKRPAVVISSHAYHRERPDIILMAITSQMRPMTRSVKWPSPAGRLRAFSSHP